MTNSIKEWLCSRVKDFDIGVALYNTYGTDERLKESLKQGLSPFRMGKLTEALKQLAAEQKAPSPVVSLPKYTPVNIGREQLPETSVPEKNDQYRKEWLPLYAEMNALRARLRDFSTDEERGKAAIRIKDLEEACESIWERRDYHLRTGAAMKADKTAEMVVDPVQQQQRLNNVRSNISKTRKRLELDPGDLKAADRLKKYEQERDYLESQIKSQTRV